MKFIFGVRSDIKDALHFWDKKRITYPAGHNIVDYNIEEKKQKFYSPTEDSISITAVTMSNNKTLIAFAEEQKTKGAFIHIYDKTQRKRRCLISPGANLKRVEYISFSTDKDERYILMLYGEPEWSLVYWFWNSPKPETTLTFDNPIISGKCTFSPIDFSICVVTGYNTFRYIRIGTSENDEFTTLNVVMSKVQSKEGEEPEHSRDYTSHCWMKEKLLVISTKEGELIVLGEDGYFLSMTKLQKRIDCMSEYSSGVIVSCEGPVILLMSFKKENKLFECIHTYTFGQKNDIITSIGWDTSFDNSIFCITSGQQLLKAKPGKRPQEVICSFHSKEIIDMDICIRKPLIATCSEDNTIRLWNYIEATQELEFQSPEIIPLSIAFHPSGLYLAVGTIDKVYLMSVYFNTLKITQEVHVKLFRQVSFSNGGQYLAISHSNIFQVYNFYTMESIERLTVNPAKIQSVEWFEDDSGFISIDQSNYVSFFGIGIQPVNLLISNKQMVTGIAKIPGSLIAYAASSDSTIKEVTTDAVNKKLEIKGKPGEIAITRHKKLFFIAVGDKNEPGVVKCYKFPLTIGECSDIQAHAKPIKRMKVSRNDKFLFTGGEDGCIIIYVINERERIEDFRELPLAYSTEILTDTHLLTSANGKLEDLITRQRDLASNKTSEQEAILADLMQSLESLNYQIKKKQIEYENQKLLRTTRLRLLSTEQEEDIKSALQVGSNGVDQLKRKHLERYVKKSTEYSRQIIKLEGIVKNQEDERDALFTEQTAEITKVRKEYEQRVESFMNEITRKQKELNSKVENQRLLIQQMQEDHKSELNILKDEHNINLQNESEQLIKVRGEHQLNSNKTDESKRNVEELNRDIKELNETIKKAENEQCNLELGNKKLMDILEEKGRKISNIEQEIYQHKKEVQKLEKFKFVLDSKIKDLKHEMNPREQEITKLKDKTSQMDKKLKKFNKLNIFLGYRLKEIQEIQRRLQSEITNNREKLRKNVIRNKERLDALEYCAKFTHSPADLRDVVIEKLVKYKKEGDQVVRLPAKITEEFKTQEEFMLNSVRHLQKELVARKKARTDNNKLVRSQNRTLISEIQKLRGIITKTKGGRLTKGSGGVDRYKKLNSSVVVKMNKSITEVTSPVSKAKEIESDIVRSPEMDPLTLDSAMIDLPMNNAGRSMQIEDNKETIKMLRARVDALKNENQKLKFIKKIIL